MAIVFGASSPNTTWRNVMKLNPIANATRWTRFSGSRGPSTGSMSAATAGSPIHPSPSEAIVIPSWVAAR